MKYSLGLLLLLFGCATVGKYEERLQSWVGRPESELVQDWGPPSSTYPMADGSRMLTWSRGGTHTQAYYNQLTRSVSAVTNTYGCDTTFTVDGAGTITRWRHEGNNCKSE